MHAVLPVYVFGIGIMCLLGAVRYCTLNPGPMYRGYRIGCNNTSVQPLERPGSRSSRPGSGSLVYAVRIGKTLAAFLEIAARLDAIILGQGARKASVRHGMLPA